MAGSSSNTAVKSTTTSQKRIVQFHLLPQNEFVNIPDELFIYSGFLREYKRGMLNQNATNGGCENYTIPLAPIKSQPVERQQLEKLYEFFSLYTRHNYGPGSSAKKVPSSLEVRTMNIAAQKSGNMANKGSGKAKQEESGSHAPETSASGTFIADIEAKADSKWSKLPDWAHGWFSALDKNLLIGTANVANFLTATPFTEHYANFVAVKVREMETPQQIMEYLNYVDADPEGDELKKLLFE